MTSTDVNPAAEASLTSVQPPLLRREHADGELARLIEQQSAKIPSHWFLFGSVGATGLSLALKFAGRPRPRPVHRK